MNEIRPGAKNFSNSQGKPVALRPGRSGRAPAARRRPGGVAGPVRALATSPRASAPATVVRASGAEAEGRGGRPCGGVPRLGGQGRGFPPPRGSVDRGAAWAGRVVP